MPESTIIPRSIQVRKVILEGGAYYAYVYLRDSLSERTIEDELGEQTTLYVYNEVQVRLPLPTRITDFSALGKARRQTLRDSLQTTLVALGIRRVVDRRDNTENVLSPGSFISRLASRDEWGRRRLR